MAGVSCTFRTCRLPPFRDLDDLACIVPLTLNRPISTTLNALLLILACKAISISYSFDDIDVEFIPIFTSLPTVCSLLSLRHRPNCMHVLGSGLWVSSNRTEHRHWSKSLSGQAWISEPG